MGARRWEYALTTVDEGEVPAPPDVGYRLKNVVICLPKISDYLPAPERLDPKVVNIAAARREEIFAFPPLPSPKWTLIWEREVE